MGNKQMLRTSLDTFSKASGRGSQRYNYTVMEGVNTSMEPRSRRKRISVVLLALAAGLLERNFYSNQHILYLHYTTLLESISL